MEVAIPRVNLNQLLNIYCLKQKYKFERTNSKVVVLPGVKTIDEHRPSLYIMKVSY